ncbi:sigma-70 family RNA polymerase sigma factor [Brevundimonas sp.]|uniref:sigma-70 family RNA polymerase sigma factor n=1 Tax=Brevundimonas sp. TaxID=1871086 RepID=UPI003F7299A2
MKTFEARLKPLMIAGLDGEAQAWRAFLQLLRPALHAYFNRRQFQGDADVEDLVQDALLAIHAKRETWRRADPVTSWCFTIARYKLIDHLRKSGRAKLVPLVDDHVLLNDGVEDGAVRQDLAKLLEATPPRQRRLIEDVKLSGYSLAEAGERLGMTEGAAKVSLHRAMKTLMKRVADREH